MAENKGGKKEKKENPILKNAPKHYVNFLHARPQLVRSRTTPTVTTIKEACELLNDLANKQIADECNAKEFTVESILSPCTTQGAGGGAQPVDLVIVIDTSGSMDAEAVSLSNAAAAAIKAAQKKCPSDLNVTWLGIEGTFAGTNFNTTLRDYLHGLGIADADIKHRIGNLEDGARSIEDISIHFNWRAGSSRAILFLGDEPLEGGSPQEQSDKDAADDAISTANSNNVNVFTYAGSGIEIYQSPLGVKAIDEYERVATSTGGIAYSYQGGDISEFQVILEEIICANAGTGCEPIRIPEIRPCFELQWGDGPNDHIETDDVEVLCLKAWNPYSNVTLKDVTAYVLIIGVGGIPALLPDGTPSVYIKPSYNICFGDLAACGQADATTASSVSREIVLISRGAKEGPYYILVVYCYSAEFHLAFGSAFPIELVKS